MILPFRKPRRRVADWAASKTEPAVTMGFAPMVSARPVDVTLPTPQVFPCCRCCAAYPVGRCTYRHPSPCQRQICTTPPVAP